MLKQVQLSPSAGLSVSQLCLGTMNFGIPGRGHQGDWTLDVDAARPIFESAKTLGLTYFDCANVYGLGASEEVVGQLLSEIYARDEFVLTTKVAMPMGRSATQGGLSRKHILESVEQSLERLGLDYVDQLIIHRHPHAIPGQPRVPIEETMEALHDLVKAGKTRYLGASSMAAWQFAKMQQVAERQGWTRFIAMQPQVNLIYREEEREMLPLCQDQGVGVIPWSPLARGKLTRPWETQTHRSENDLFGQQLYKAMEANDRAIVERVRDVAEARGVSMAQVALAWLLQKPGITSPIIGATKPEQLTDALTTLQALNARYHHPLFNVSTLKLSLDGTVEAKTAVMLEPYIQPEGHEAKPLLPNPVMFDAVAAAHAANVDLHLHAIGDGAVRSALDAIERAKGLHPDSDTRTTICHIEIVHADDVSRFAELGAVAQTTPTWFYYDDLALRYLGVGRFNQMYPLASILRHGGKVTLGSDYPVSWIGKDALNPMFNIEMAVTRQQAGNPEVPVQARVSERLSVDQAIRAHTSDAAWQLRLEDQIGTLEVGKLADIVVLDRDPYTADPYAIHTIQVDYTFSDGRLVYRR